MKDNHLTISYIIHVFVYNFINIINLTISYIIHAFVYNFINIIRIILVKEKLKGLRLDNKERGPSLRRWCL